MSTSRPPTRRLFATVAGIGLTIASVGGTASADCGCAPACHSCTATITTSDCDCGCNSGPKRPNLIYKSLDTFAGGIEKLLGLDKCHRGGDALQCDDACDAAMIDDLMMPMGTTTHAYSTSPGWSPAPAPSNRHHSSTPSRHVPPMGMSHSHHGGHPAMSSPEMVPAPQHGSAQPTLQAPGTKLRMSEPRLAPSQSRPAPSLGGGQSAIVPPPVRVRELESPQPQQPANEPQPQSDSIFDSLSNPFADDDDAAVRRPMTVRPSNYEPELQPISKRAIPSVQRGSSRRLSND